MPTYIYILREEEDAPPVRDLDRDWYRGRLFHIDGKEAREYSDDDEWRDGWVVVAGVPLSKKTVSAGVDGDFDLREILEKAGFAVLFDFHKNRGRLLATLDIDRDTHCGAVAAWVADKVKEWADDESLIYMRIASCPMIVF